MKHDPIASGKRKSVNLSIDTGIVAAARDHGINLSQVSEAALREATRMAQNERWKREHQHHFDEWNAWVAKNGLPLAKHRLF